jgi:hypothetical protein
MFSLARRAGTVVLASMVVAMVWASPTRASVFEGTFQGIAENSWLYDPANGSETNFDGAPVSGTFFLDTAALPSPETADANASLTLTSGGTVQLGFQAIGRDLLFGSDPTELSAVSVLRPSFLALETDYLYPYAHAWLQFDGPLFDGVDPASAHSGQVDLSQSSAYFELTRSMHSGVRLTQLEFTVSSIPEPQTWLLMLVGGVFVGMFCKRRLQDRGIW